MKRSFLDGRISAIVPTYNRADFLVEAIEALQRQTRPVHQIIVFNDGSTDHTAQVMADLEARNDPVMMFLSHDNSGKSKTLNKALTKATGDYIWVCDDDDVVLDHAAERLGHVLDNSDVAMVSGRHTRFRTDPETGAKIDMDTGYWPDLSNGSVLRHLLEDIFFFQPATLVRRSALDAVGPFREDLSRSIDYEMFVRLASRFPAVVVDEVLFEQRKHDGERGSSTSLHSAADATAVWKAKDREIFEGFRDVLPLSLYTALFEGPQPILCERAGLLQRGCVYARRSDWDAALRDFEEALTLMPDSSLSAAEYQVAIRAFAGKHGCAEAYRAPYDAKLIGLKQVGRAGRDLCKAFARGSVWRFREAFQTRQFAEAARILKFIVRAGPPIGGPDDSQVLSERDVLPKEAFAW